MWGTQVGSEREEIEHYCAATCSYTRSVYIGNRVTNIKLTSRNIYKFL